MSELLALLISGYLMLAPQACATLDAGEVRAVLRTYEVQYEDEWVALAMAESGGNTCATNSIGNSDAPGSTDHGLWQVNDYFWGRAMRDLPGWRTDLTANLTAAMRVQHILGWDAWATWRGSAEATCDYWTARGRPPCR